MKLINVVGIIGFLLCLLIMYTTNHGPRGIQKCDPSFRLPDMRFHYSGKALKPVLERIGEEGRKAYKRYLLLDFIFISCFLITMLTITNAGSASDPLRILLIITAIMRAVLDVMENTLLLHMLNQYPKFNEKAAAICSWSTTLKFIMLYAWLFLLVMQFILQRIK